MLPVSYQNDPQHLVSPQPRLGSSDRLNEDVAHIGSAIFCAPAAPKRGRDIGQDLFEQAPAQRTGRDDEGHPAHRVPLGPSD